jgi:uncharacterized membrane protein
LILVRFYFWWAGLGPGRTTGHPLARVLAPPLAGALCGERRQLFDVSEQLGFLGVHHIALASLLGLAFLGLDWANPPIGLALILLGTS